MLTTDLEVSSPLRVCEKWNGIYSNPTMSIKMFNDYY